MRSRITTNNPARKAGTSVKLSTFAILGEEEELIEKKLQEAERQKEDQERCRIEREKLDKVRTMNWADVPEDDEDDYIAPEIEANEEGAHSKTDSDPEDFPVQVFLDIKSAQSKSKRNNKKEDIDTLLAGLQRSANTPTAVSVEAKKSFGVEADGVPTEDRTKAMAQLRAKIAAAGQRNRKPAVEDDSEKKKKTKKEKKEARRHYER